MAARLTGPRRRPPMQRSCTGPRQGNQRSPRTTWTARGEVAGREQQGGTSSVEESLFLAAKKGERQGDGQGCLCPLAAAWLQWNSCKDLRQVGYSKSRRRGSEKIFSAIFFERYSRMKPAPVAHKRRRDRAPARGQQGAWLHAWAGNPIVSACAGVDHWRPLQLSRWRAAQPSCASPLLLLPLTSRSSCCAAWPVGALQACRSGIVAPPRVVMWRMIPTPASCQQCACALATSTLALVPVRLVLQTELFRNRRAKGRFLQGFRNHSSETVLQQDSCHCISPAGPNQAPALHTQDAPEGSPNGFYNRTLGACCAAHMHP